MMHKNPMTPKKENMQISTSSPVIDQVKKYNQEVETSNIFKKMLMFFYKYLLFHFFLINFYIYDVN